MGRGGEGRGNANLRETLQRLCYGDGFESPKGRVVSQYRTVKQLLLRRRDQEGVTWPWLTECHEKGRSVDKVRANKFMLGAILDYRIDADVAWENARRLAEDALGEPKSLWVAIASIDWAYWDSDAAFSHYRVHHLRAAHRRVWCIGTEIVDRYKGDSRLIWRGQTPSVVLNRLLQIRVGDQISRMIVGALIDTAQIVGQGDLKADVHVRKVLGRVFRGNRVSAKEAHEIADRMVPGDSWKLDGPLFLIGKKICKVSSPLCDDCDLNRVCMYCKAR